MYEEQPKSARTEILIVEPKRSLPKRSASQRAPRRTVPICCADCKLPLLIEMDTRDTLNKSRVGSTLHDGELCRECAEEKTKNVRSPASRLMRSTSINWTNMGENIETWFEKAQTPDQRVVFNFLQQINNKPNDKPVETPPAKDLDDVLSNLKKYQTRFNSARPRSKFTRLFESSSWRVMRQPARSNRVASDNLPITEPYPGSIFASTDRRMRSTFLIHPNWI